MALRAIQTTGDLATDRELETIWRHLESLGKTSAPVTNNIIQKLPPLPVFAGMGQASNDTLLRSDGKGFNMKSAVDQTILINGSASTLLDGTDYIMSMGNLIKVINLVTVYGCDPTGTHDCSAKIATAWAAALAAGGFCALYAPAGTYLCLSSISLHTTATTTFTQGICLIGAGSNATVFSAYNANSFLFDIDSSGSASQFYLQDGVTLTGFAIDGAGNGGVAGCSGIKIRHAYRVELSDVVVQNIKGTGFQSYIDGANGDTNASLFVDIHRCRFDACATWGIETLNELAAGRSLNQHGNIRITSTWIRQCGTAMGWAMNTTTPTSGGLKWKGQLLHMENVSFTENQNIGFLNFYDGLGQGLMATLINCDFENNPNHIWWQACQNVVCLNTRIVNNNVVRGYNGIIIDSLPHYLDYTGAAASTATSCTNHYYSRTFVKVNITATPAGSFRLFRSYGINFAGLEISANNLNEWDSTYIEFDPSLLSGQARPIINNRGYRYNHPDTQYQYYGTPAATEFREPHVTTTPVNVAPDNDKIHSYYVELGAGSAAITIQPPVTSSQDDGKVVEFTINNQSGGNVAVTWTGNYKTLKYIDPPNGFRTTARFRYRTYDPGGGLTAEYLQVTPWTYGEVPSTVYSLTPPVGGFIFTALAAGGEFLASTIYRTQNNLSQNNWIRFVVNNNVGVANTPVLKLQYSTDNFATVTVDLCSVSLTTAGIIVSAWVAIPAGALGEVQFRLFGSATAINTICTLGVIEAQVK